MATQSLVDYLQNKGVIDQLKANEVRVEQSKSLKTEEQVLQDMNVVPEEQLAQAKSELFKIPFIDLRDVTIAENVLSGVNAEQLRRFGAVPFEHTGNELKVAMLNPFDVQAIQALQTQYPAGTHLKVYITTSAGLNMILDRMLGEVISSEVSAALEDADVPVAEIDETQDVSIDSVDLQNAPVARIVNSILHFAVKSRASDIHIEPQETKVRVRFRIHGVMSEKLSLPKKMTSAVVARIKIMSNLKIDEKRVPQDGRFPLRTKTSKVDVRVSIIPTIYGEKVVLRLLDATAGVPKLEMSGMRGNAYKTYIDSIKATSGIILITGPTGSGKTQTLAGSLEKLNDPKVNIVTLENPVEIRVPGVTQIQINPDVGLTFAAGLRSVLRQDPDIIMVGEIRDEETAKLAVEASLTGHLVLSTLHTNSAAAAIPRLLEMGIESYLLASTLDLAAAQRLPRRICSYCREEYISGPEAQENIKQVLESVPNFNVYDYLSSLCEAKKTNKELEHFQCPVRKADGTSDIYLYRGKGCDRCNGTGYSGRVGIFEVLKVTEEIGALMMQNRPASEIEKIAIRNGMVKMLQDGYLKALEGITTVDEVLRVSKD